MSLEESGRSTVAAEVAAVSIKLPPFWPSDPLVWFAQVEAQFTTRGVSSQKTRFDYVVASLSPQYAMEVRDLILAPPTDAQYDTLKELLIKRTAASEQRRLQQLFHSEDLGDRKPSQLLRRMQQLLGDKASSTDSSFLRELFLQRLPANVRMILASTMDESSTDLERLADLADKVTEVAAPTVSAVATSQLSSEVEQLRGEISDLKQIIQSWPKSTSHRDRGNTRTHRSPSPARPRPVSPHQVPVTDGVCWYHAKFQGAARKCKPPCSWAENDQARR